MPRSWVIFRSSTAEDRRRSLSCAQEESEAGSPHGLLAEGRLGLVAQVLRMVPATLAGSMPRGPRGDLPLGGRPYPHQQCQEPHGPRIGDLGAWGHQHVQTLRQRTDGRHRTTARLFYDRGHLRVG